MRILFVGEACRIFLGAELEKRCEMQVSGKNSFEYAELPFTKLPKGYDVYVIHASEVSVKEVRRVRDENPGSWIVAAYLSKPNARRFEGLFDTSFHAGRDIGDLMGVWRFPKNQT